MICLALTSSKSFSGREKWRNIIALSLDHRTGLISLAGRTKIDRFRVRCNEYGTVGAPTDQK